MEIAARGGQVAEPLAEIFQTVCHQMHHLALVFSSRLAGLIRGRALFAWMAAGRDE